MSPDCRTWKFSLSDRPPRLRRTSGWPALLRDHLTAAEGHRFSWGSFDCALFASDWVLLATGHDPAAGFRGRYRTANGARRQLRRLGTGYLWSTFGGLMPLQVPAGELQRGDIAAGRGAGGEQALGVVGLCGRRAWFPSIEGGIAAEALDTLTKGWRV